MPRPNRDYTGSSHSLPTLVSSINISDSGLAGGGKGFTGPRDIRNKVCVEDANWDVHWLSPFIRDWVAGIPDCPRTDFDQGVGEHWKRDIDTNTGHLLGIVAYPDSFVNHADIDSALEWRRQNWSSTLLVSRHNTNRQGNHRFGKNCRGNTRNHRDPVLEIEEGMILEVHETPIERPEYNRYVPRIPCFLRPAEKYDMEGSEIDLQLRRETGLQTLDSEALSAEVFEKILNTAQKCGMPFIVAARGSARELGLTKGNLSYSVFRQIPSTEKVRHGEILGFTFLSPWQPGLACSSNGSSRARAKIHVYVHPLYRRKNIGFSLLDMLLTTVSDRFSSQTGYDFIDPNDSSVYKNSATRERQYFRLYISYMVKHQNRTDDEKLEAEQKTHENDLVWVKKLLKDQLNFTEVARYRAVHRSPKGRERGVHWLDEVVFEHTCRFDLRDIKEGY
ncbi:hypothetical protein N657DRAFT_455065 [Parathielavia appendiculata]|uniref:Uncharacterized protein n=1 Tax=Parathielavia appendiculata TaxID=2587402 RepID=A0AAN6TYT9_9PEZI|nr:hypothetical protein N657DRAFT_455065 [Parathielavia appendiculata]